MQPSGRLDVYEGSCEGGRGGIRRVWIERLNYLVGQDRFQIGNQSHWKEYCKLHLKQLLSNSEWFGWWNFESHYKHLGTSFLISILKSQKNKMAFIRIFNEDHGIRTQLIHPLFTETIKRNFKKTKGGCFPSFWMLAPYLQHQETTERQSPVAGSVKFIRRKKLYLSSHQRHWQLKNDTTLQYFWYHLFEI